jgi:hypothetical protein
VCKNAADLNIRGFDSEKTIGSFQRCTPNVNLIICPGRLISHLSVVADAFDNPETCQFTRSERSPLSYTLTRHLLRKKLVNPGRKRSHRAEKTTFVFIIDCSSAVLLSMHILSWQSWHYTSSFSWNCGRSISRYSSTA